MCIPIRPSAEGVTPSQQSVRKGVGHRFEAAAGLLADRLPVGLFGLAAQGSGCARPGRFDGLPAKDPWPGAILLGGWDGCAPSQPFPMPRQASAEGGCSGHGRPLPRGTAAPAAMIQLQDGRRHPPSVVGTVRGAVPCTRTPVV